MPYKNSEVITFENGLEEFLEPSRLAQGFATELENWVPEPDGSLRLRMGWQAPDDTGAPAVRQVKSMAFAPKFQPSAGVYDPAYLSIVKDTATQMKMYAHRKSELTTGGETLGDTFTVPNADRHAPIAVGMGAIFYTTPERTLVRKWNGLVGSAAADIAGSKGGRSLLVYKNRLFSIGHLGEEWKLFYTALGDPDDWSGTSAGNISIGSDDGDAGNALAAFEQGILIGKENTLWYLLGTNPNNFNLVQLNAGDAAPGNSIVQTPAGAIICGKQEIFLFNGGQPRPISRPIGGSYGVEGDGNYVDAAYVDGKVHIAVHHNPTFFTYDLATQAWSKETFASEDARPCVFLGQQDYLVGGVHMANTGPLFYYRRSPGGQREVDSGGITLKAATPELWLNGAAGPFTMRRAAFRVRQRGGDAAQSPLTVTYLLEGREIQTDEIRPESGPGVYRVEKYFGGTGYYMQFRFEQVLEAGEKSAFDIEEVEVLFETEKSRGGKGGGGVGVNL